MAELLTSSPADFISKIATELDAGYGFVPLTGTGISAPSGIPIIRELEAYLAECIARALGVCNVQERKWHPRTDNWPPLDCGAGKQSLRDIQLAWNERVLTRSYDPEIRVFQEAVGALADWRTGLLFLARIAHAEDDSVYMTGRDNDVIDTFFLHVVRDKRPTLAHRMMAMLADVMRFDTLLTTNFDELAEQAFAESRNPLTTFDVHLAAGLPPFRVIQAARSLIKLHGGRYGLRADYSLDTSPSPHDMRAFTSYLTGESISDDRWEELTCRTGQNLEQLQSPLEGIAVARNHLLVVGFSGSDRRIMQLISATHRRTENLKMFWVAYSERDVRNVTRFCRANSIELYDGSNKTNYGCIIVKHRFVGMLFLEMFQRLSHGLPSAGAVFPAISRLPFPPIPVGKQSDSIDSTISQPADGDNEDNKHEVSQLEISQIGRLIAEQRESLTYISPILGKLATTAQQESFLNARRALTNSLATMKGATEDIRRLVVLLSKPKVYGVTTVASTVFYEEVDRGSQCLWLDMDDVASTDDLCEQLLDAIARKQGVMEWMPVLLERDPGSTKGLPDRRTQEIGRLTGLNARKWIIFLNARDGAGTESQDLVLGHSDELLNETRRPNGWLDDRKQRQAKADDGARSRDQVDHTADTESFISFINDLAGPNCPNVTCVLLCQNNALNENNDEVVSPLVDELRKAQLVTGPGRVEVKGDCLDFDHDKAVESVAHWATVQEGKTNHTGLKFRFLTALVTARRTRYPALTWSRSFHSEVKERQVERVKRGTDWLNELEELHAVRFKPGGFIWLHRKTRNRIRTYLRDSHGGYLRDCMEANRQIGSWYHMLFLSSEDPMAAFEAIHHFMWEAITTIDFVRLLGPTNDYNTSSARRAVEHAVRVLETAKPQALRSGFSKVSCRKLTYIRCTLVGHLLNAFRADGRDKYWNVGASDTRNDTRIDEEFLAEIVELGHRLNQRCLELKRDIAREVAENRTAFWRQRQLRELIVRKEVVVNSNEMASREEDRDIAKEFEERAELSEEYCRWYIETATLCISTRSYADSQGYLLRVYRRLLESSGSTTHWNLEEETPSPEALKELVQLVASNVERAQTTRVDEWLVHVLVKTLLRHMQLAIVQGQVNHLYSRAVEWELEQVRRGAYKEEITVEELKRDRRRAVQFEAGYFQLAECCYKKYDRLERYIAPSRAEQYYFSQQVAKTQLSTALAAGRLDFAEAHRRLREANAATRRCHENHKSLAEGIIELHRAEVYLYQCVQPTHPVQDESISQERGPFFELRRRLFQFLNDEQFSVDNPHENAIWWRKQLKDGFDKAAVKSKVRYLHDAGECLDRAEAILKANRKNVWWVTWYYELRLKHVEYSLFASVLDRGEPVPVVGHEASPADGDSEADIYLANALRLIRLDALRLASCVLSYANSIRATFIRLVLDPDAPRMLERQRSMRLRCADSIDRLSSVFEARQADTRPPSFSHEVVKYVEFVKEDAGSVANELPLVLG